MSIRGSEDETRFQSPFRRAVAPVPPKQKQCDALTAELQASLVREEALKVENGQLLLRQAILVQEFEHRLLNGLQLISSLLSLQSRTATPEAAAQLNAAVGRVAALGRVHHRLHLLDNQTVVDFKQYLQHLCADLAGLVFEEGTGFVIVVEAATVEIPTAFAIPLGFIVNELITNSAKYAKGTITVKFETTSSASYSLSVIDNGPGLPVGFDPANSKGLGMRIVLSLVKQIGGELHTLPGYGTRFTVAFSFPSSQTNGKTGVR